ncbi:MAG: hypothetical protein HOH19_05370 [Kordiimonadaceae bacterium]|jgi:hypothetical protein|nr:hypothetical protein [Kordiimonadaceae bacterium]MBT6031984.1 hypothetical protein [Kordiimonadaceae bacterium]
MKHIFIILSYLIMISSLWAQDISNRVVPCAVPFYRDMDFTVGEWQVFHKSSGKLAGYDRIGRVLKGCAIQQSWVSLDDHFSSPYVPFRMSGRSITAFDGSQWVQMWVDNQAGVQILKGGPQKDRFVLKSEDNIGGFEYMLTWQKQDDGTLLNTHQRRENNGDIKGKWQTLYEWVYKKNLNQELIPEEDEN